LKKINRRPRKERISLRRPLERLRRLEKRKGTRAAEIRVKIQRKGRGKGAYRGVNVPKESRFDLREEPAAIKKGKEERSKNGVANCGGDT